MNGRIGWIGLVLGAVTAALIALDVPGGLRGPEGWQWARRPLEDPRGLLAVLVAFVALVGVAAGIRLRWGSRRNVTRVPSLIAAVILVFVQMVLLTAVEPGGLSNLPRRVLDPSFTSYHTIARDVGDRHEFLRDYARLQSRFPVHGPSQPPGRVLFFDAVNRWASAPGRTSAILGIGERLGGVPEGPARTTDGQRAGALVAAWLLLGIGALCLVPLVVLVGGRSDPAGVAATVLLTGCLPSVLLFTPQTDHLLLLLTLTAAAFLVEAMRYASRAWALILSLAAGVTAGACLFVSLTALAALFAWALALAGMLAAAWRRGVPMPKPAKIAGIAAAGLVGLATVPVAMALAGMDWPAVVRECFAAAHRVQVLVQGRDYATWVRWNLWDFALFLGPPLVLAWLARIPAELRTLRAGGVTSPEIPFGLALLVAVLVLDLSGTILGETGRIWMFLMPLAVAAAATGPASRMPAGLLPLAGGQFLVLLALRAFVGVPG